MTSAIRLITTLIRRIAPFLRRSLLNSAIRRKERPANVRMSAWRISRLLEMKNCLPVTQ